MGEKVRSTEESKGSSLVAPIMVPSQPAKLSATPRKKSDVRSNEERMADAKSGEMEKAPRVMGAGALRSLQFV